MIFYENIVFSGGWIVMVFLLEDGFVDFDDGYDNLLYYMLEDVFVFLMWIVEFKMMVCKEVGFIGVFIFVILFVLFYLINKKIWVLYKGKKIFV